MKLHRFVVTRPMHPEVFFDDVRTAFQNCPPGAIVFVTYEPTGLRVPVRRP